VYVCGSASVCARALSVREPDDVITVGRNRVPELEDPYRLEMLQHACSLGSTEAQYRLGKYYLCQDEDPEEEVPLPQHTRTRTYQRLTSTCSLTHVIRQRRYPTL
jgi:hypothetical protein